jgi:hypothetical protein
MINVGLAQLFRERVKGSEVVIGTVACLCDCRVKGKGSQALYQTTMLVKAPLLMYNGKVYQLEGEEKLRWVFFPWVLEKVHRLERLIKSVQGLGVTVLFKMYGDRFLEHRFQNLHAEILAIVFFFCKVELCP